MWQPPNLICMKMQKITTSFSSNTDAKMEQKANAILQQMTGNSYFTTPVPSLTVVADAIADYSQAVKDASTFDRVKVSEKNDRRQELEILLSKLGMYVMNVALGNATMLTSSGFALAKPGEPQYLENPGNVDIANGITTGEMVVSVPRVKAARSYQFELATEPPTPMYGP